MLDDWCLTSQKWAGKRSPCPWSSRSQTAPGGAHGSLQPLATLPRPGTHTGLLHRADAARQPGDLPAVINPARSLASCFCLISISLRPNPTHSVGPTLRPCSGLPEKPGSGASNGVESTSLCWKLSLQWFLMDVSDCRSLQWCGLCAHFQLLSLPWLLKIDFFTH